MGRSNLDSLLGEMDRIWRKFVTSRVYFGHMRKDLIGYKGPLHAPYYRQFGLNIVTYAENQLTQVDIDKNNATGHYINQNFIIRLYALLDSYEIKLKKGQIDKSIDGGEELDLLCRLRHVFAHTTGKYDPTDEKQRILLGDLIIYFGLEEKDYEDFVISIDTVLKPMFAACKDYVSQILKKHD